MSTQEFGKHCWHWLVLATARSAFPQSWCLKILTAYGHGSSACSSAHPPWIRGQVTACTAHLLEFIMHPTLISPTATSRHAASTRRVVIIGAFPKNFRRSACIHSGTTRTAQLCCGNAKAWLPPCPVDSRSRANSVPSNTGGIYMSQTDKPKIVAAPHAQLPFCAQTPPGHAGLT